MKKKDILYRPSPFGRTRQVFNASTGTYADAGFDWKNAVIDSIIIAAVTFFTALAGTALVGVDVANTLISAAISASAEFFTLLAIKRGLQVKQ